MDEGRSKETLNCLTAIAREVGDFRREAGESRAGTTARFGRLEARADKLETRAEEIGARVEGFEGRVKKTRSGRRGLRWRSTTCAGACGC